MAKNTTKQKPNGYWEIYENNYNEALKYKSRNKFSKGNQSAYHVARKNGWLDNYTWFEQKQKHNGYWNYETCYQEAKKYKSRREFSKGCSGAYRVALKNDWLDNYTWFEQKQKHNGYWNYETCYQEALKYNSRKEFQNSCQSAYNVALKNDWLDKYTWFIEKKKTNGYWNYETCYQEARKYNSRHKFEKGCGSAYQVALKNGWLDNYTWFSVSKTSKKWTYETCFQKAQKYKSRSEFAKGGKGAYEVARKNGWLDIFFPNGK